MEEFPSHAIAMIFAAIIGAAIVTFGYMFYAQNRKAANTVSKAAITQKNSIADQRYANYDEVEYTGSGILRTIKLFQKEDVFIKVEKVSATGTYDTFIKNEDGTRRTDIKADYDNAKYKNKRNDTSTVEYIPQDQAYISHLVYSDSGAIIGIEFTIKT